MKCRVKSFITGEKKGIQLCVTLIAELAHPCNIHPCPCPFNIKIKILLQEFLILLSSSEISYIKILNVTAVCILGAMHIFLSSATTVSITLKGLNEH
jgi:hypothetical protein